MTFKIVTTSLLILLSILSTNRLSTWSTEVSLWTDNKNKSPKQARVRSNLASALYKTGEFRLAYKEAVATTELYFYHPDAHYIIGDIFIKNSDYENALKAMNWASLLNTKYTKDLYFQSEIHLALSEIYSLQGRAELAELEYQKALKFGYQIKKVR